LQSEEKNELVDQFVLSSMVLRTHRDKTYPGAMTASLSVPWGNSRDDRGGYHLVWPRDFVQCATALLAFGAEQEVLNTLRYLIATQKSDGSWYQNQWVDGSPYWQGLQLDEVAFPVLLAASMAEREAAEFLPHRAKELALALADFWNDRVESWTAVRSTPLARRCGVEGYYIRVALSRTSGSFALRKPKRTS
jgi:glucoamylase